MNKEKLALTTWVKLSRAYNTLNRHIVKDIRTYDLTPPQFAVLECLGHLGSLTPGQLCEKILVTGGNMTVVVDNLEKDHLVQRQPSSKDRRVKLVSLTAKGQALFDEIFPQHAHYITEIIEQVLSQEEQEKLSILLKKLGTQLMKV